MGKLNLNEIRNKAIVVSEPDFSYIDGKYLRAFRMNIKMSQALFADYLGVTKKAVEKWEQGKNKVNPVVARMIYLMERDQKIFSLLKPVSVANEKISFNPVSTFATTKIIYDEIIIDPNIRSGIDLKINNEWDIKEKNEIGGFKHVAAGI